MGSTAFLVPPEDARTRLDLFLARRRPDLTRSRIKRLVEEGRVLVDGRTVKAGALLAAGSRVELSVPAPQAPEALPEAIPLSVLFEDRHLLVLDKPPGLVVHPAHGHASGTLVNALLHHCRDLSGVGGVARPGIVHRLDKGTSGVMVVAKTDQAHLALSTQFKDHTIGRVYLAAVRGTPSPPAGTIARPLGRHQRERKRIAVRAGGRAAITAYRVLGSRDGMSLLELRPGTGRTHQLRVHLSSIGHPILGDSDYGGGIGGLTSRARGLDPTVLGLLRGLRRPALHASSLEFDHPAGRGRLSFEAPPPPDIAPLFEHLGRAGA